MRLSLLLARLIGGPLINKMEDKNPGSGCLIIMILLIIGLICAALGIGNYN